MAAKYNRAHGSDTSLQQALDRMTVSTCSVPGKDLNLLIVGKTGVGKSSTGNSILGRKVFESNMSDVGVTKTIQTEVGKVLGHRVKVVDCPGLMEPTLSKLEGLKQFVIALTDTIMENPTGFNAILVVTRLGQRLTEEDMEVFKRLNSCFGDNYMKKYGILVVTHEDTFEKEETKTSSLNEFFDRQTGFLNEMKDGCDGRLVTFNNKSKDSGVPTRQRERLFDMVKQITQREGHYTPDIFKQFQAERDKELLKLGETCIRDETNHELNFILEDFRNWQESSSDVSELEGFKSRLREIRENLVQQDKGTGVLKHIISSVRNVEDSVAETMSTTVNSSKMQVALTRQNSAMDNLNTQLQEEQQRKKFLLAGVGIAAAITVGALIVIPAMAAGGSGLAAGAVMANPATAVGVTEIGTGASATISAAAATVAELLAAFVAYVRRRN